MGGLTPHQATARRLEALQPAEAPVAVCNAGHRFPVDGQLNAAVVLEPPARNTAPALAVAAAGASDLVIVDTGDAVLVADRRADRDVATLVGALEAAGCEEAARHRRVLRPWGACTVLHLGDGFRVEHIVVESGRARSLQWHRHRAEHRVAVRGRARVTREDETFTLAENRSTFIAAGVRHRLANPGAEPLEMVEVQSGNHLGEDDIVRHGDAGGRAGGPPPACRNESADPAGPRG